MKKKKKWDSFPLNILEIPLEEAKNYRDIQTNHKNFDQFQLAIFAAYHYWTEVANVGKQRQIKGKKSINQSGKTAQIVAKMGGTNEKYTYYAHKLLDIDKNFFYDTSFIKRYSLHINEVKELLAISNNQNQIQDLISEIKKVISKNTVVSSHSEKFIYGKAKTIFDNRHAINQKNVIRKLTASDTESEEIKNALLAKFNANDSNVIEFDELKKLNTENFTAESKDVKLTCLITISQSLPESILTHIKTHIESNTNYSVEIQQAGKDEVMSWI